MYQRRQIVSFFVLLCHLLLSNRYVLMVIEMEGISYIHSFSQYVPSRPPEDI